MDRTTQHFNPHHPRGWRPVAMQLSGEYTNFNPHHPRGWRPVGYLSNHWITPISIHTTLAGGDVSHMIEYKAGKRFQSTPPSRVATTVLLCEMHPEFGFQSTPPSRVATFEPQGSVAAMSRFQSTPPSRVATQDWMGGVLAIRISIHTTLAGGDIVQIISVLLRSHFNPHHPRGWRPGSTHT